jgi:hypothetical protein
VPASQTDQLMLWRDGQSYAGGPDRKKKMPRDDSENGRSASVFGPMTTHSKRGPTPAGAGLVTPSPLSIDVTALIMATFSGSFCTTARAQLIQAKTRK